MKIDLVRSFLAQRVPDKMYRGQNGCFRRWLWRKLYLYYSQGHLPVRVYLHGRSLVLNAGNPYPFILADAPHFNAGLVIAATCLKQHLQRPLKVVDAGSSIGDTVVLLDHHIPRCIESCICIDGAEENRQYFEANTAGIRGVSVHFSMLSAATGEIPSLVRHHRGTAMASGNDRLKSETLDRLLVACGAVGGCDLLKIDVDGYDGEVLLGAAETLSRHQPLVIFEWHPYLIRLCQNDPHAAFRALAAAGYRKLLWFSNRGLLSHLSSIPPNAEIDWWSDLLITRYKPTGPHFDIVALPPALENLVDPITRTALYPN